jgi:hypothetical protein
MQNFEKEELKVDDTIIGGTIIDGNKMDRLAII